MGWLDSLFRRKPPGYVWRVCVDDVVWPEKYERYQHFRDAIERRSCTGLIPEGSNIRVWKELGYPTKHIVETKTKGSSRQPRASESHSSIGVGSILMGILVGGGGGGSRRGRSGSMTRRASSFKVKKSKRWANK